MVDVPGDIPVMIPLVPIVATPVLLLLHVPPVVVSLATAVNPTHTGGVTVIGVPEVFTATVVDAVHPVDKV